MAKLLRPAQAGTVESSDILVSIAPAAAGTGIRIDLESATMRQFGEHIKTLICHILQDAGIEDAAVHANDKGAVDFVVMARVKTAIMRAMSA